MNPVVRIRDALRVSESTAGVVVAVTSGQVRIALSNGENVVANAQGFSEGDRVTVANGRVARAVPTASIDVYQV